MREDDDMPTKWTREMIIRQILDREAQGLLVRLGAQGVSQSLYQAGIRIFGSWRNALQAAGIPPERVLTGEKWSPAKILVIIRNLSRRCRPLSATQLERRYGNMQAAARRLFGSWSKAVVAAGVDPVKLQRVIPWSPERVIETILTRALRNEPLSARSVKPRSLLEAGQRFYGSWAEALRAAGLDAATIDSPGADVPGHPAGAVPADMDVTGHKPRQPWTNELVIAAIQRRLQQGKPLTVKALYREDNALYRAATRHFGSWCNALLAAGLHPLDPRKQTGHAGQTEVPAPGEASTQESQANPEERPDQPV
jgi:hypothetical protein